LTGVSELRAGHRNLVANALLKIGLAVTGLLLAQTLRLDPAAGRAIEQGQTGLPGQIGAAEPVVHGIQGINQPGVEPIGPQASYQTHGERVAATPGLERGGGQHGTELLLPKLGAPAQAVVSAPTRSRLARGVAAAA